MAGKGGITSRHILLNAEAIAQAGTATSHWIDYGSPVSGAFYVDLDGTSPDVTITMHFSPYTKVYLDRLVAAGTTLTTDHYIAEAIVSNLTSKILTKYKPDTLDDPIGALRVTATENDVDDAVLTVIFEAYSID